MKIEGTIVDIPNGRFVHGFIKVENGKVSEISSAPTTSTRHIIPGFVDAHVHTESSMLSPAAFGAAAVKHGTVGIVCDPHEVANVNGMEGMRTLKNNSENSPVKFAFGAPPCVPATPLEPSGATISAENIAELFTEGFTHLSEVMNFPGVLNNDSDLLKKISIATELGLKVDGHAPGLKGEDCLKYAKAGISTDHECFHAEEALEKLNAGMKIMVREGSAAKNFEALFELTFEHFANMMFCTDDLHPDDLLKGHINKLVARAIEGGLDPMRALQMATVNPVEHYNLPIGLLQEGDPADFIVVESLTELSVEAVYIDGVCVSEKNIGIEKLPSINNFHARTLKSEDIAVPDKSKPTILAQDGELITLAESVPPTEECNIMACLSRYEGSQPATCFVKNFDLKKGAIASSVAHDSHNIVAVGSNAEDLCHAINLIITSNGGLSAVCGEQSLHLPLPISGLMTNEPIESVASAYEELTEMAKSWGSKLSAPYMTLSFMSLLVIPELKLGANGLFDVNNQRFI